MFQDVSVLPAAERIKDEFITVAAHQLRNPISVLIFYTEALSMRAARRDAAARSAREGRRAAAKESDESDDSARLAAAIDAIHSAAERLSALTDDLLDITRLQAGRLELQLGAHDLLTLARQVTERMQVTTTQHTLGVETTAASPSTS